MAENRKDREAGAFGRRLARTRWATAAAMAVERVWPLLVPSLAVAGLFLAMSWLGLFRLLPDWARLAALALLGLAFLAALLPLRLFRRPSGAAIDRRIERTNGLAHAPVLTQKDRLAPGTGDAFAEALWAEHRRRMAAGVGSLASDLPRAGMPERDPWGLRAALALLLVVAFAFSYGPLGGRLSDALTSHGRAEPVSARIDAWVTPPDYTGRPPVYLTAEGNRDAELFRAPAGSAVAVRVTGAEGAPRLTYLDAHDGVEQEISAAGEAAPSRPGAPGSVRFDGELVTDGLLTLHDDDAQIASWAFNIVPDAPPRIDFADDPRSALNGALELRYEASDDYGIVAAEAVFEQAGEQDPDARPLYAAPEMALPLPRRAGRERAGAARVSRDLTEHPWSGAPVRLSLRAEDAAGQEGFSEERSFILPERPFNNPLARALIEQRRMIALDANAVPRVLALMNAIGLRPEDTIRNYAHYLGLVTARSRLAGAGTDDDLRDVVDYLWEMALTIEDGNLSAAERRLRQAQEALSEALEEGADEETLAALMDELRAAMDEFLREFAERAARNPQMTSPPMDGQEIRQSDLQRMMDQIEDLARSGSRDAAQDLLAQLQDMMNNLQAQGGQQQGGEQSEMQGAMNELGELMQRQQQMMNETFDLERRYYDQPMPGEGEPMSQDEFAEAMRDLQERQGQLQQQLQELTEALEGMGIEPGEGFGEAGEAMGRAEGALGDQRGDQAVGEQGEALQALRRGAQDMMQQMQAMEGENGQGRPGGVRQGGDRDPLGRPRATSGPDFGDSVRVPDEIDVQRAREILEEIRRRLGDALSPAIERDYLERLLDMR